MSVDLRSNRVLSLVIFAAVLGVLHRIDLLHTFRSYRTFMLIALGLFLFSLVQLLLSWWDKRHEITPEQQVELDQLNVVVNIPVYNEDPPLLDRALFAVFGQTRLPNHVEVVDDGSKVDYTEVREYWMENHPAGVKFTWARQENRGKKRAQAVTFAHVTDADIYVTLDSDSTLEYRAIDEALKPFVDPKVQSVAGLELAYNYKRNAVTRVNAVRSLVWQLITCTAQSVFGDVLVNRGTFAAYRGALIRENLENYVDETFFGYHIELGDDAALTLFARGRGKAVQQTTAVQFAMYPETLSHHVRQWIRWMRGLTIRTFWRLKYLPWRSYGWIYTVINLWMFFATTAIIAIVVASWPNSETYAVSALIFGSLWGIVMGMRVFAVKRSDESRWTRFGQLLLYPVALVWVLLVLRPLRFVGIFGCLRQGWGTRKDVEVFAK